MRELAGVRHWLAAAEDALAEVQVQMKRADEAFDAVGASRRPGPGWPAARGQVTSTGRRQPLHRLRITMTGLPRE